MIKNMGLNIIVLKISTKFIQFITLKWNNWYVPKTLFAPCSEPGLWWGNGLRLRVNITDSHTKTALFRDSITAIIVTMATILFAVCAHCIGVYVLGAEATINKRFVVHLNIWWKTLSSAYWGLGNSCHCAQGILDAITWVKFWLQFHMILCLCTIIVHWFKW